MRAAVFLTLTMLLSTDADESDLVLTEKSVDAQCGQNVTLKCSLSGSVKVLNYSWTYGNKTLCEYNEGTENCNYTDNQELLLTIHQVSPRDSGKYVCMLMANKGHGSSDTELLVSDCNRLISPSTGFSNHGCTPEISFLVFIPVILWLMPDPKI